MNYFYFSPLPYFIEGVGQSLDGHLFVAIRYGRSWSGGVLISAEEWRAARDVTARNALSTFGVSSPTDRAQFERDVDEVIRKGTASFTVATRTGFFGRSFVLPNSQVYGENIYTYIPIAVLRHAHGLRFRGSLEKWKQISRLAGGNSRLLLALSVALSGPVADYLRVPAPMVNLFGGARTERAVIARAAASVVGGREGEASVDNWDDTVTNLEVVGAARHAMLLVVDGTKAPVPVRAIQGAVMHLDQESESGPNVGPKLRVPLLSVSDQSYCEMALGAGLFHGDTYSDRMIDIPLAVRGSSAFECLHGAEDATDFCVALSNLVCLNYGQALRHLIQRLLNAAEPKMLEWLCDRRSYYANVPRPYAPYAANGGKRVRERFATVYAAGSLAIRYGLLPGTEEDLCNALLACERAHLEHVALLFGACQGGNPKTRPN